MGRKLEAMSMLWVGVGSILTSGQSLC